MDKPTPRRKIRPSKEQAVALKAVTDRQLECQVLRGHPFRRSVLVSTEVKSSWRLGRGKPIAWECQNCGTRRIDVIDPYTGEVVWREYIYPEWWTHFTRDTRLSAGQLRLAMFDRDTAKDKQATQEKV